MKLSATQRAAVEHAGSLALLSCPGSGKTRTLAAKLVETLDEVQGTTRLVACITYTNAAVHEIESRLSLSRSLDSSQGEVETIHSFCLKHIVGPHSWHLANFTNGFSILVPEDAAFVAIVDEIVKKFALERFAKEQFEQLGRGTDAFPDGITEDAANAYWAELDRRGLMDFSSIIFWAAELVQKVPYIARGLASMYRWILVDEFQDTSSLQVNILRALHRYGRTKFFLVGDPYQSIMTFAGARPELLQVFGAEIGARSDLQLLDNYRSSRNVLRIADNLCPRESPMVAAGDECDYDHVPVWHTVATMLDGVVRVFVPEVAKRGIQLRDVAILANRWTSLLPLSRGLRASQIPAIGPGTRPYKRSTHVIAPLVEEVAAHVTDPDPRGVGRVRREVRRLVQTLTKGRIFELGFAGDVSAARIVRAVQQMGYLDGSASNFLGEVSQVIAAEMVQAGFLSAEEGKVIVASGTAMVDDIARHETDRVLRATTVRDLGLFTWGSNSIRLLTMHGSKGREFDAVALIDVFDGHVPFYKARPGDSVEAEGRRLLYVAITRARKLLMIFTLSQPHDRTQPSRFLHGLFPRGGEKVCG